MAPRSMVTFSVESLSARIRPSRSRIRPRIGARGTVRTWLADATCASWSLCTTCRYQRRPKRATKSEKTTMPMTDNRTPRVSPGIPHILPRAGWRPKSGAIRSQQRPALDPQRRDREEQVHHAHDQHDGDEMDVDGVAQPEHRADRGVDEHGHCAGGTHDEHADPPRRRR